MRASSIFRYCFTLELTPRLKAVATRVRLLPLGIALVLMGTRLLPKDYLRARPQDTLRVSRVLADAANRIQWQRSDIDRILIFGAVMLALVILVLQTIAIAVTVFVGHAHAAEIFSLAPADARNDIVMIFLDQIFGVPGIFDTGTAAVGTPVHAGVHALLQFYSQAMMIIATLIIVYYVVVVVGEAAQTGTPFGKRFNGLWAPIRLVLALGLLVPLGSGLNTAQYITLYAAKAGSAFASNAWSLFASKVTDPTSIVTAPDVRDTRELVKSVFVAEVCRAAMGQVNHGQTQPVQRVQVLGSRSAPANIQNPAAMISAAQAAGLDKVTISWTDNPVGPAIVDDTCGRVSMALDPHLTTSGGVGPLFAALSGAIGPLTAAYVGEVGNIVNDLGDMPNQFASIFVPSTGNNRFGRTEQFTEYDATLNKAARQSAARIKKAVDTAYSALSARNNSGLVETMAKLGWGGAGLWYVKIGQLNQRFQTAVRSGPAVFSSIVSGEPVVGKPGRAAADSTVETAITQAATFAQRVDPVTPPGNPTVKVDDGKVANEGQVADSETALEALKDRPVETILNFVFKTERLRLLRTNPTLDPMVVLVSAGDRMIQQSMAAFMLGVSAKAGGETVSDSWFTQIPGWGTAAKFGAKILAALGGFMTAIATIGFMAGIVLFYVLPILPFFYFFFSIIGWGLSIVEALVAGPLWALAHLHIDGEGMPGQSGSIGYFILFEIMLRPILIVAGLILGYTVFGAGAYLLATVFDSVTNVLDTSMNTAGFATWDAAPATNQGASGGFDNFIYTIVFTIIVYGLAVSCFKLADKLPNGIMRWLGGPGGASPFSDGKDAPDMQGTMLAGGAAVGAVTGAMSSGFATAFGRGKGQGEPNRGSGWWRARAEVQVQNPQTGSPPDTTKRP